MSNYQTIVVYAPISDICYDDWQEKINKKYFNCGGLVALKQIKQICPNIKTASIEHFTDHLNCNEIDVNNNWFGVIYVEM